MESERLRAIYIPPPGGLKDLQRVHEELFASEGIDLLESFRDDEEEDDEETPQDEE